MRTIVVLTLLTACQPGDYTPPKGFVTDQRIAYTDGLHNENTDLLALDDRLLLIFRGGETGQIGSELAHINVYASFDDGATWEKQAEVNANTLPGGRDIRDPKLVAMGDKVYLYATSRLPGGHYRDLGGKAWCVRAESSDRGVTWTEPVKTMSDVDADGHETFWDLWRFTKHSDGTLYATGYADGDVQVGLFASQDGVTWEKRSLIIDSYEDVPSEAELQFYGDNDETAVSIVRMDNQGILQDGQSAVCTAPAPFTDWECGRRIEQRLDGPAWLSTDVGGARREFVVARKHLPCTAKRTAIYELRGDLADPASDVEVCELATLQSAGDTAYTALAPLSDGRYLTSWYTTPPPATGDVSWLEGTFGPSDIWVADVDFDKAPRRACPEPPPKEACPTAPLPTGDASAAAAGDFLVTIAPVIFPSQTLSLRVTTAVPSASTLDLSLQFLDAETLAPVGEPFAIDGVAIDAEGRFTATTTEQAVPASVMPLLADPFLTVHDFTLQGVITSADGFCGDVTGYAQVAGVSPSDRIDLQGSTFGGARIAGEALPTPVVACPAAD